MAENEEKAPGRLTRARGWLGLAALAIVAVVAIVMWRSSGRQSTDDAQIDGAITQIAARVGGTVAALHVRENATVDAGTVLVELDPRDYQVAVDRARAELADAQANLVAAKIGIPIGEVTATSGVQTATGGLQEAQAGVAVATQQIEAARAQLVAAEARQREKEAAAVKAARDVERLKGLVAKDEIAQQQYDGAVAAADAARAASDAARSDAVAARAAIAAAEHRAHQSQGVAAQAQAALREARTAPDQLRVTRARADVAEAKVRQANAALAQAELNLERTKVLAPTAGIISRKSVEKGQVIQAGQPLSALVSRDDVWITANFKETQLKNMQPGQRASIAVDGLAGRTFQGHIESIAPATGAKFSLLPPENAAGNYVKVVQRVPVRIALDAGQDPGHQLRPGMSVTPTVFTK
jgi:membrane fusion protein (multidrug efflux system)